MVLNTPVLLTMSLKVVEMFAICSSTCRKVILTSQIASQCLRQHKGKPDKLRYVCNYAKNVHLFFYDTGTDANSKACTQPIEHRT